MEIPNMNVNLAISILRKRVHSVDICFLRIRPLVDTFKMYLCTDTATFCQMYLCTDTIQYQYFSKISKVSDTDTCSINFWP